MLNYVYYNISYKLCFIYCIYICKIQVFYPSLDLGRYYARIRSFPLIIHNHVIAPTKRREFWLCLGVVLILSLLKTCVQ